MEDKSLEGILPDSMFIYTSNLTMKVTSALMVIEKKVRSGFTGITQEKSSILIFYPEDSLLTNELRILLL